MTNSILWSKEFDDCPNGDCDLCPLNTFKSKENMLVCTQCVADSITLHEGSTSEYDCLFNPEGDRQMYRDMCREVTANCFDFTEKSWKRLQRGFCDLAMRKAGRVFVANILRRAQETSEAHGDSHLARVAESAQVVRKQGDDKDIRPSESEAILRTLHSQSAALSAAHPNLIEQCPSCFDNVYVETFAKPAFGAHGMCVGCWMGMFKTENRIRCPLLGDM